MQVEPQTENKNDMFEGLSSIEHQLLDTKIVSCTSQLQVNDTFQKM